MAKQTPPPPLLTYISKKVSDERTEWYLKHKRPIMDKIVHKYNRGHTEREYFYYSNPLIISDLFKHVLKDGKYTGIRIYLGSCEGRIPTGCDQSDKGKLVLIYVPTIEKDGNVKTDNDSDEYYKLRVPNCSRVTLTKDVFDELVLNYETDKRVALRSSLSVTDLNDPNASEETKHLFIHRKLIDEINNEIDYQLEMSAQYGVAGIKVYINSYTDVPIQRDGYDLCQRLTVQFVFTDDSGQDLDLMGIDSRYNHILKDMIGYNTINPTPPYPDILS